LILNDRQSMIMDVKTLKDFAELTDSIWYSTQKSIESSIGREAWIDVSRFDVTLGHIFVDALSIPLDVD